MYIKQLFNLDGSPISAIAANHEFELSWLKFNSILIAIPTVWRKQYKQKISGLNPELMQEAHIQKMCKPRAAYQALMNNPDCMLKKKATWEKELDTTIAMDTFQKTFKNIQ